MLLKESILFWVCYMKKNNYNLMEDERTHKGAHSLELQKEGPLVFYYFGVK